MKKLKELFTKYKSKVTTIFSWLRLPIFAVVIGFFGSYAGSHGTSLMWRRLLIPAINTVASIITSLVSGYSWYSLWHITCMAQCGAYAMGYGIPDDNWPPHGDSGSDIGRFWTMFFRRFMSVTKAHRIADYFTRSTVALFKALFAVSIPIIKGNWICYGIGAWLIILVNAVFSWRGMGSFKVKIFNKEVEFLWSDIVTYTVEGLSYYIMIFWKIL